MPKKPVKLSPTTRICCLTGNEQWESPEDGKTCRSHRHGHMTLWKCEQLIADGKMEWVKGIEILAGGKEKPIWIPVAKFVNARRWRKTYSGGVVAVMQLVAGG